MKKKPYMVIKTKLRFLGILFTNRGLKSLLDSSYTKFDYSRTFHGAIPRSVWGFIITSVRRVLNVTQTLVMFWKRIRSFNKKISIKLHAAIFHVAIINYLSHLWPD